MEEKLRLVIKKLVELVDMKNDYIEELEMKLDERFERDEKDIQEIQLLISILEILNSS